MTSPFDDENVDEELSLLFEELASSLQRLAWTIVRDWQLAADAVQEAFLLLGHKWSEVESYGRRAWLAKTVQFQAYNLLRKQQRSETVENSASIMDPGSPVEHQETIADEVRRIQQKIEELPHEQRIVLEMRLHEELSFAQIAQQLDLPLGTVLSRMRLALQKLRKQNHE